MTYVVLESQYQSSLTKACQRINDSRDDVCVECVGYLLEELRDPKNVAAFKKDVESSNIFIGSLIFVQVRIGNVAAMRAQPWPLSVPVTDMNVLEVGHSSSRKVFICLCFVPDVSFSFLL